MSGRLGSFSQLLEETKHLCGCGQEKVAKIVGGEHLSIIIEEVTHEGGLTLLVDGESYELIFSRKRLTSRVRDF